MLNWIAKLARKVFQLLNARWLQRRMAQSLERILIGVLIAIIAANILQANCGDEQKVSNLCPEVTGSYEVSKKPAVQLV